MCVPGMHLCGGGGGGGGLKSMCELCACVCITASLGGGGSVCPILEIFSAYFCYIRNAISPHSKEILNAALCMYKRVCTCVFKYVCTVVYPGCVCVRVMHLCM